MNYITVIKYAALFFPFFALLFTLPFILIEYHKFGSISLLKSFIIYIFIFYIICAYFLVILPLPKFEEVSLLTTPRTQLIPFKFIIDFIKETSLEITNPNTYLQAIKESCFYIPIFNIFLTIPFGMFLRYYLKCNLKQTIIYTFLLTLFFELTQLSGLYFIYPRSYRLFDADDLILNTLGGLLGFIISKPIIKILPSLDEINYEAKEKGKIISGFRRSVTLILDLVLLGLIEIIINIIFGYNRLSSIILIIIYFIIIPIILNGSTLAQKFLNIKVVDYNGNKNIIRLILRKLIFITIYLIIPYIILLLITLSRNAVSQIGGLLTALLIISLYFVSILKYTFTKKDMIYEKISKTKLISTITQ